MGDLRMGFVDLHSHVLHQLDDGSKDFDESMQMIDLLRQMGFDTICATPHQKLGSLLPERTNIDAAYAELDGAHGPRQCKAAQHMVLEGLAHAVASDLHGPSDARAVGAGIAWIKKKRGQETVHRLLDENPREILAGALPERER